MRDKDILDSWKAISVYLGRDSRTCYRWDRELGLPVYRIDKDSPRSKVFAYKSEIDNWLKEKSRIKKTKKKSFFQNSFANIGLLSGLALSSIIFVFLYFYNVQSSLTFSEHLFIAVLPFENHTASEHDEYLSEGMTNSIIKNLTMTNKLKVIPLVSVSKYKNIKKSTKQICKELGVDYILKGNIRKYNNKVSLSVQFFRAKDNTNIWSAKFEEPLENIFSIQDNICQNIYETLNSYISQKFTPAFTERKTQDYYTFDKYLKGNYILNGLIEENNDPWALYHQGKYFLDKFTQESNEIAICLFYQAIENHNNFAHPYIGLARCYANYVSFGWDYKVKWLDKAEDLAKKAQMIEPNLPEYFSTLSEIYLLKAACFNKNTIEIAYRLASKGIKKYPNHAQINSAVGYCYFLKFGAEGNESYFIKALEYKQKSFWLNPYALSNNSYAKYLMLNNEFTKAIEVSKTIKKISSSLITDFLLGEIYYYKGDLDKSKAIFKKYKTPLEFKIGSLYYLGMIASQEAKIGEAKKIIQKINLLSPREHKSFDNSLKLASICLCIGKKEAGYNYLKLSVDEARSKKIQYICYKYIYIDKNFKKFKTDKEFVKIIRGEQWLRDGQFK